MIAVESNNALSCREVSKRLRVSQSMIMNWAKTYNIPYYIDSYINYFPDETLPVLIQLKKEFDLKHQSKLELKVYNIYQNYKKRKLMKKYQTILKDYHQSSKGNMWRAVEVGRSRNFTKTQYKRELLFYS